MKKKKYKILPVIFAIMVIFSTICIPSTKVMADDTVYTDSATGLKYALDSSNNATIKGYSGSSLTVNIPSQIGTGNYSVTGIGEMAFSYWGVTSHESDAGPYYTGGLTSITIPNSVKNIGNSAFCGCTSLTSLEIPDGVTTISDGAFFNCVSLNYVKISNSVTNIGSGVFALCSNLTSISVSEDSQYFKSIDGILFSADKKKLVAYPDGLSQKTYTIPDGVTNIGDGAFMDCDKLTSIIIPDSVTNIGDYAFSGCGKLTGVIIPDGVTNIGNSAFYGGNGLISITIPNGVTNIGNQAFQMCQNLKSVTIPNSVTNIGNSAFEVCKSLNSVTIEEGVTKIKIGFRAFRYCSKLTRLTIPNSVEQISDEAFKYTSISSLIIENSLVKITGSSAFPSISTDNITIYQNPNDTRTSIRLMGYDNIPLNTSITAINAENATVSDYNAADIEGVTNYNLDAVNSAVAAAKTAGMYLTRAQIQNVVNTVPYELKLAQSDNTLTAQLKKSDGIDFTTSSAVTYEWYRNDSIIPSESLNTYTLSDEDKGANIKAKVTEYDLQSNSINIHSTTPSLVTGTASSVSTDAATLNGTVNANGANTTVTFEYGTTTPGDKSVAASPASANGTVATSVSTSLSGLIPKTLYYFRVVGSNSEGISYGSYGTFTTALDSYTVTFKDYDGTIIGTPQIIIEGQDATKVTDPVRFGYTFTGWDKAFTNITENTVVTATYTQNVPDNPPSVTTPSAVVIPPNDPETTTPSAVTIKGTTRVGNTLEAIFLTNAGAKVTTGSGVTYEWYRLYSKSSNSDTLVGADNTYKLVSSDADNYIKLIATYNGQIFEAITERIRKRSSSSHSSSSSNNSDSSANTAPLIVKPAPMPNGWQKLSDNTWKYGENGEAVIGWKQINNIWYLFDSNGTMEIGFKQEGEKTYYLNSQGAMATGWELVNGSWYLFDNTGAMLTGWKQVDGKWYYLNPTGVMATGWISLEGKWYYLNGEGSLAVSTVINGYTVDENGVWIG